MSVREVRVRAKQVKTTTRYLVAGGVFVATALAGCSDGSGGDPGASGLPVGASCESVRADLNKLDSKGVPALIEAQSGGKKLSPEQKSQADLYNKLLNQYLGARCHTH